MEPTNNSDPEAPATSTVEVIARDNGKATSRAWAMALATADAAVVVNNQQNEPERSTAPPVVLSTAGPPATTSLEEQKLSPAARSHLDTASTINMLESASASTTTLMIPPTDVLALPDSTAAQVKGPSRAPAPASPTRDPNSILAPMSFADWKQVLASHLANQLTSFKVRLVSAQDQFDQQSLYIRGDFHWRKQLLLFHGQMHKLLDHVSDEMTLQLQQDLRKLSQTVDESLEQLVRKSQTDLEMHRRHHDQTLSHSRNAMKKEMLQFTMLEKCLRKEEVLQAKTRLEQQLCEFQKQTQQTERELRNTLRDIQSAYNTLQLQNEQLELCLQEARGENQRLKKTIAQHGMLRGDTSNGSFSPGKRASDAYVQSLRAALNASNQQYDALKSQMEEVVLEKENGFKELKTCEEQLARVQEDHSRAKQLLSDAHGELQNQQQHKTRLLQEINHLKDICSDYQFQIGTFQLQIQDLTRLNEASKHQIASLEAQLEHKKQAMDQWMESQLNLMTLDQQGDSKSIGGPDQDRAARAETLLSDWRRLQNELALNEVMLTQQIETRLRYEFESKYGAQLNNRVSHERKRTLARVESHCAKYACGTNGSAMNEYASVMRRSRVSGHRNSVSDLCAKSLQQIVSEAYNDLGLGEWSSTDVEELQRQIRKLNQQIAGQNEQIASLMNQVEQLKVALAKDELVHKEKDALLAEILGRHRELRADYDALRGPPATSSANATGDAMLKTQEDHLTVYGLHPPLKTKDRSLRVHGLIRPVSASPCITRRWHQERSSSQSTVPPSSSIAAIHRRTLHAFVTDHVPKQKPMQDHVRSELKDELLVLENQRDEQDEQEGDREGSTQQQEEHKVNNPSNTIRGSSSTPTTAMATSTGWDDRNMDNDRAVFGKEGVLQIVRRRRGRSATLQRPKLHL